ncbi:HAD family hydrolase [Schaalia vaccimaxillae]|uniref:HAD family hydrolase n=1 Tax=Schaalia vaccimaxillae TaxID=183916 RepID=UPI0003B5C749|nr:HAD hydrolase-like protein [Schaalia vaccimaxillae]
MPHLGPWSCLLFDIDGTLVDSAPVVIGAFETALGECGYPIPSYEELQKYVGPPLWWSIDSLGYFGDKAAHLLQRYKEIYDQHYLEPQPFAGIKELLVELRQGGYPMATASSKDDYMAEEQMRVLGFDSLLDVVAGANSSRECTKATVIADALECMEAMGHDVSAPVLIGDSIWDIEGAHEAGLPVIAVGWGYPGEGGLSGADAHAETLADLRELLLPHSR